MTKKLTGLLAAATLAFGGLALAQDDFPKEKSAQEKSMQGMKQHELTGQVVKVERNTLYVEQQGAIVPLKLDNQTQFRNLSKNDLKEGQEIRASFTVQGDTTNVAREISMTAAGMEPGTTTPETETEKSDMP